MAIATDRKMKAFGWILQFVAAWLTALAVLHLVTLYGPRLEGFYMPVVADVHVTIVDDPDRPTRGVLLSGDFIKERDCEFVDAILTFKDLSGMSVGVPIDFIEGVKVRGTGPHEFGPWAVGLTSAELAEHGVMQVYHRCHPFWITVTKFYP